MLWTPGVFLSSGESMGCTHWGRFKRNCWFYSLDWSHANNVFLSDPCQ